MAVIWRRLGIAILIVAQPMAVLTGTARAEEGFWPYANVPVGRVFEERGVRLGPQWLTHLQRSSVRFGGLIGSGSFVSTDGLVLTNRHVLLPRLGQINSAGRDLPRDGFTAATQADEVRIPDVSLDVLVAERDVTAEITAALEHAPPGSDMDAVRRRSIVSIERQAGQRSGMAAEVVAFFEGGRYAVYIYKRYQDVRLVFCPESAVAWHWQPGLDITEFAYPSSNFDVALARAYDEQGNPVHPEHYLRLSRTGPVEGQTLFVSGSPTVSTRHLTVADFEFQRDIEYPFRAEVYGKLAVRVGRLVSQGAVDSQTARDFLAAVKISRFIAEGKLATLQGTTALAARRRIEEQIKHEFHATDNAGGLAAYASIAALQNGHAENYVRATLLQDPVGLAFVDDPQSEFTAVSRDLAGPLLGYARALARLPEELAKDDGDRSGGFHESERQALEHWLLTPGGIDLDVERVRLQAYLEFLVQEFGPADSLVTAVLAGQAPAKRAAEVIRATHIGDPAFRRQLFDSDATVVAVEHDPLVEMARTLERAAGQYFSASERLTTALHDAHVQLTRSLAAIRTLPIYPDATHTLRLSYGSLQGYREHSLAVPAITTLASIYDWYDHQYGSSPFLLPARWLANRQALVANTPCAFISTVDGIGGNSGSPTVDEKGELIGVLYGGTLENGVTADVLYQESKSRAIHLAALAIVEVLRNVYEMPQLAQELRDGRR